MFQIYLLLRAQGRFYTRSLSAWIQKNLSELDTFRCNSIVMLLGQDIRYVNNSRNNLPAHTHKIMEAWRSLGFSFLLAACRICGETWRLWSSCSAYFVQKQIRWRTTLTLLTRAPERDACNNGSMFIFKSSSVTRLPPAATTCANTPRS